MAKYIPLAKTLDPATLDKEMSYLARTIFASAVVATFAAVLQKLVQNAVDIKSENDLTV